MTMYPPPPAAPKKSILPKIGIACFVVGAIVVGFFVWRIVVTAPRTPQPIEGGVVHLKKEGLTIYASIPVLNPPCEVQDPNGNDVPIKPPSGSETITINGESWYVVARSTQTVPAGDYSISCTDDETSATYSAGPKSSVFAFVLSILGTVFSFLIFLGLGITFLTVGAVKKRRRNRPPNTFPGQPGAPGNYPYPPVPPQQNHTFPAPPPYNPGPNPDRPQNRPQDR
ncbi:hypothetical protein EV649_1940 [Kribbella sp. VKM Ac-2569]|uniref:hypothetical protein n=1 Tax=Kribbella sp. VKM Ac-2569 TaxID=2512220 RepID=UPI00102B9AEE|nr:hypothetical protein [Kribbella sp. VKM Ac-2569]RZT28164.1 hypothetical protein EV649_1940 [Kribbella sp. VKM Ac-2569]